MHTLILLIVELRALNGLLLLASLLMLVSICLRLGSLALGLLLLEGFGLYIRCG